MPSEGESPAQHFSASARTMCDPPGGAGHVPYHLGLWGMGAGRPGLSSAGCF